ncbi:MAG: FtsW/RodA/SpoVE family cell cycle protein [Candidatus Contendobacter sp.]|nr:FtsW/RodA/SpoVE family cell cycle protein [Candidatus Contendobacter sp.]
MPGTHEGTTFWRRWFKRADQEQFLFSLGGEVPCPHRWPLPGVPARGLEVLAWNGAFWLAPGGVDARMARAGQSIEQGSSFKNVELRLDDPAEPTTSLFLGHTQYRLRWQENVLTLTPVRKANLWLEADWAELQARPRDSRVKTETTLAPIPTQFAGLGTWLVTHWLGAVIVLGLALCAATLAFRWPGGDPTFRALRATAWASAVAMGTLTLMTWRTLAETQPAWLLLSLGLAWSLASALLFVGGRLRGPAGWLWVATLGLVGCGSLVQGQLGLGGDNNRWLDFGMEHWCILATVGWVLAPLALVQTATWRRLAVSALDPWTPQFAWLKWAVIGVAGSILAVQFALGGEEGFSRGVQPVEGIKTLLALMLAHAGARLWRWRESDSDWKRRHPIRTSLSILAFVLVLVGLTSSLLLAVRDLSPLLLMLLLLLPWLWCIAPHPIPNRPSHWAALGRWGIPLTGILLLFFLWEIARAPEHVPHWLPQYDRIMVWADPAHFRESGFQVQRAMELIAAGGWSGAAASSFGWNGAVMRLPVVQNDFIGAFLLHRFGVEGGWVLLIFQGMFAAALFALARDVEAWGRGENAETKATGIFLSLALFTMAWLILAHWTIAWGNTLGLLPVMGQPMTFVSLANSHHLFFALPGLILGLATGWMIKPSRDAPEST